MNPALAKFLMHLDNEPIRVIGLIITPPAVGTVTAINAHYQGQYNLRAFPAATTDELADMTAAAVNRMLVNNQDTLVIDLESINGSWLQASEFDYMLRALMDNTASPLFTLRRVVLISQQKGFKLSPATMALIKTFEVETAQ